MKYLIITENEQVSQRLTELIIAHKLPGVHVTEAENYALQAPIYLKKDPAEYEMRMMEHALADTGPGPLDKKILYDDRYMKSTKRHLRYL